MAEKIKCIHCYKKYDPDRNKKCPLCGLPQSTISDTEDFIESQLDGEDYLEIDTSIADLQDQVNSARSSANQAAAGLFIALLGTGAGFFLVITGYVNQLRCLVEQSTCAGGDSTGLGIAVVGVSYVIALGLSVSAMLR